MQEASQPRPLLGGLFAATISVPDLNSTVAAYSSCFGYEVNETGTVSPALAASWGTPATAGSDQVILAPASGANVHLRLISAPAHPAYRPLRTHGWASIELTVAHVDALAERLAGSPFRIIGEPHNLNFSDVIRAMQVIGPAGEVLLLTQFLGATPEFEVPRAKVDVDQMFVAILATPDLDEAKRFYFETFLAAAPMEFDAAIWTLNDAFGLGRSTSHRIASIQLPGQTLIELDQYPEGASTRGRFDGALPPGVALISFRVESLDDLEMAWLTTPQNHEEAPYSGRRSGTLIGPAGELIELVENPS